MNIVFAGTPEFAATHLEHLIQAGHTLSGVWTQPDKPGKRGTQSVPSAVKLLAEQHHLQVFQPARFGDEAIKRLTDLNPDVMIVVAYGQILPAAALPIPRFGCLNVHASILPRWRGAAPIQRAIQAGDMESGVSIMQMDAGLDTGDILAVESCVLSPTETSGSLTNRLARIGTHALSRTLEALVQGTLRPVKQDPDKAVYAAKVQKKEARIDWDISADQIARNVRMLNPSPTAYTWLNDLRVRVWLAHASDQSVPEGACNGQILELSPSGIYVATHQGVLVITQLQIPLGKGSLLTPKDICNARRELFAPGAVFSVNSS
jgi:methionyl-tRNA formyltransferase